MQLADQRFFPQARALVLVAGLLPLGLHAVGCQRAQLPASGDSTPKESPQDIVNRGLDKDDWWDQLPRAAWSNYPQVETSQDWFEVYLVHDGVFAIYEPGQFEEVISYLITGSDSAVLFDTGLGIGDMKGLTAELTALDVAVINSHSHYDHVGANHAFSNVYGADTQYTRKNMQGRGDSELAEFVGPGWIWKATPALFSREGYESKPWTITHWVEDGTLIDLGDVTLEVLLTPGHAPDSLCLLDRERRLLFTGDTLYPATLYAHLPGNDFRAYQRTAKRLSALAPQLEKVLPAHNEPHMTPAELVAFGRAFAEIETGDHTFLPSDGNREYDFGRFSILVAEPPPWDD